MGVVFEAIDTNLNRTVAIKMLRRFLAASGVSRRRFIREARASAAIRHPNVITVYSTHDDGDLPFLVMEYIQGPTLQDHIVEHGRLDPIDVVRMARDIAYGLAAAHRQGVVHRDIKPSNILLESDLSGLKISDFGLARASFDKGQLTSHEIALGTPAYMSPEQITCSDHLDARSDLFSLGCVIYAMVTGHSPFQGRSALDIARRVASEVPQALTAVVPTTPRFLSDLTTKLLARDPELRFQTADEVGDVLDRFLAQINQTPSSQLSEVLATPLDISVAPSAPSPRRSRRGWWKGALGGVALLTLLWLTYDQWPRPEDAPPEVVDQGDSAPLVPNNGADVARLERVTVSREGGDCTTVAAALDLVRQGGTIHVQGPLVLSEPLFVGGGDHHRNLRLVGDDGVVFQHSGDGPLVTVSGTPGVTISGFRFEAHARQHAVLIVGDCPGLLIEDATFQAPAESPFALLYFTSAAKGAADAPMTVRNCHIQAGKIGAVLLDEEGGRIEHVRFESNLFETEANGGLLQLFDCARHVELRENLFRGGIGLACFYQARPESIDLRVINNTYVGCHHWLSLHESPPDRPGVMIHNNLLIDVGPCKSANVPPSQYAGGAWDFACNFWKAPEAFSRISVVETGRAATFVESIEFEEWDLEAGCVRIAADSPLAQAGRIGETPTYVGANLNMRR
ncbi:Probable serine/threonine-protein kinase PknB [Durusdinium trenchii]|uniref:Probable serine/threonine-protein kinase PknB n=1 Tax=Durusdinium trenchii TaxID=1381693 RepID=A0ABP0IWD2_9DINO